jgi:putative ABC transport system ATP-binding protein
LAREWLRAVGLDDHMGKLPHDLSGGQKQRVAIARALAAQPRLLLADEPTAALDSRTGRDVVLLLQSLAREQGCAVLMVTHDPRILDVADRLVQMEDGRLWSAEAALAG